MTLEPDNDALFQRVVDIGVRAGLLLLLLLWCLQIVQPFLTLLLWGAIIAVATYPLFCRLLASIGDRTGLATVVFILAALALLIVPSVMLSATLVDGATWLAEGLRSGTLKIPEPSPSVASWPLVGERLYAYWGLAADNLEEALAEAAPQLKDASKWLLSGAAGAGLALLQFAVSIVIAGLLLANAEGGERTAQALFERVFGERAVAMLRLCVATVRSVAQGVLGIALIQALLAGLGMLAVGVPGAGLWALLVLLLAMTQLPPLLVLGPVAVYVFSVESTPVAVVFLIWSVAVSFLDGLLKPLLLGRGVDAPMLVILLGAIGGLIWSGIVGLFLGSVLLGLGYGLFSAWLHRVPLGGAEGTRDGVRS